MERTVEGVSRPALARFAGKARKLAGISGPVDILISGNRRLQELNRRFRRKNRPTDVLSFPRAEGGEIAISFQIAQQNARRYRHSAAAELKILILHGMLHLAGHDHETDHGRMARIEARLRMQLRLPASLIDRANGRPAKKRVERRKLR
jgi:probable rRNA maturation factor